MLFWEKLKRRKVVQVSRTYAVMAWLLVQITVAVEEPLSLPDAFDTVIIVFLIMACFVTLTSSTAFTV